MTIRLPTMVTTLRSPADIPIRVACHGVYLVIVSVVAFEVVSLLALVQFCSVEHCCLDIDGREKEDVISSGIDDGEDERRMRLFFVS